MRRKAYKIVYSVMEEQGHSDAVFHRILRQSPPPDLQEKRFIKRLAYGTVERAVEEDAYIRHFSNVPLRRLDPSVRTVLRMALYEILHMDAIPEAVSCHEAVELLKKEGGARYAGFVNGVLRSLLRGRDEVRLRPWEQLALPKDLYEYMAGRYGRKTAEKMAVAFLARSAEVTIHIDRNKISCAQYEERLKEQNIPYRRGNYFPDAYIVRQIEDVKELPGYGQGWFFVQDESAMLPVLCAGVKPGDTVVDVCASPGGKTMHALMQMKGRGLLSYRDVSEKRLSRIRENLRRFGYGNAEGKIWDGTKTDGGWRGRADVLLADVPCSGIGIIGKKPEIRYHALKETESLLRLQREICRASVQMLRPGGVFLYSTCTVCGEENEENVSWLEEHCGLRRESLDPFLPAQLRNKMTAGGMLQILPGVQESDGFFVARLRRSER